MNTFPDTDATEMGGVAMLSVGADEGVPVTAAGAHAVGHEYATVYVKVVVEGTVHTQYVVDTMGAPTTIFACVATVAARITLAAGPPAVALKANVVAVGAGLERT